MEFVKLCPYYAEAFPFVKKKEEEFSHILCEHARKVTGEFGVLAKIISEVIICSVHSLIPYVNFNNPAKLNLHSTK